MFVNGQLIQAGMSQGDNHWNDSNIRGDYITWLNDLFKVRVKPYNFLILIFESSFC